MNVFRSLTLITLGLATGVTSGCQSQRTFDSPESAVSALQTAVATREKSEFRALFGPSAEDIRSGDPDADEADFTVFSRRLETAHKLEVNGDQATLLIGQEEWPFAVPLVKDEKDQWRFDTDAGIEEIHNRRIGRNERLTIAAARTLIDAQAEYFQRDPSGSGVKHYAQRLRSTEGKKDGLYWPVTGNEDPPPIGPVFADAAARRDASGQKIPYNGYFYRVITSQGASAPGGAMNYLVDGKLTRGWAAIAYPAEYGESGIMTFFFGSAGVIYQQDFGDDTDTRAASNTTFDPGTDWMPVK